MENKLARCNKKQKILTIPNILSVFRLCLIPIIVWLYGKKEYGLAIGILLLSGITDILDGWIARHFDMVSDLGKVLDPAADKLTQGVMLLCLFADFPILRILFFGLIVKEVLMSAIGGWAIHKTGTVYGALWHGKLTTCLIYSTIVLHLCWRGIPHWLSAALTGISFRRCAQGFNCHGEGG